MNWESSKLKQYLLGNISEEERAELDLQLLTNREFVTAIEVAEDELVDDYLDESLTPDEMVGFKRLFLNSPHRVEEIEFSRQLKQQAKHAASESTVDQLKKNEEINFLDRLKNIFFLRSAYTVPTLAVFLLILLGVSYLVWQIRKSGNKNLADIEVAQINQKDLSDLNQYAALTRLTLLSGAARESSDLKTLSLKTASDPILIRLALAQGSTSETVRIKFDYNDQPFLSLENIKTYVTQTGREVRLLIPLARLGVGRYKIKITGNESNSTEADYIFVVVL